MSEMQAGPELDALVAEKVMGWYFSEDWGYWTETPQGIRNPPGRRLPWPYSADIARAWQVVERMRADGWQWMAGWDEHGHMARFKRGDVVGEIAIGDSQPHAICRAALAVVS